MLHTVVDESGKGIVTTRNGNVYARKELRHYIFQKTQFHPMVEISHRLFKIYQCEIIKSNNFVQLNRCEKCVFSFSWEIGMKSF